MSGTLNVLIVDDNDISLSFFTDVIEKVPGIATVTAVESGKQAIQVLKNNAIEMVLLDIEMPEMDGIQVLEKIRAEWPSVDVIMMSAAHERDADKVLRALEMGAIEFIPKSIDMKQALQDFRLRVLTVVGLIRSRINMRRARESEIVKDIKPTAPPSSSEPQRYDKQQNKTFFRPHPGMNLTGTFSIVAIAVSTGGPNALSEVVPKLPPDIGLPILIVQHMPDFLTKSLVSSLQQKSRITIKESQDGEIIAPNTVYLASGGKHIIAQRWKDDVQTQARIRLLNDPPVNSVRPSADVLFKSLPAAYHGNILCVIMTGMGSDGADGVRTIKQNTGCYCLSQTADTCIVYGMPKSVADAGLSDEQVPLQSIAARIVHLAKGKLPQCSTK